MGQSCHPNNTATNGSSLATTCLRILHYQQHYMFIKPHEQDCKKDRIEAAPLFAFIGYESIISGYNNLSSNSSVLVTTRGIHVCSQFLRQTRNHGKKTRAGIRHNEKQTPRAR